MITRHYDDGVDGDEEENDDEDDDDDSRYGDGSHARHRVQDLGKCVVPVHPAQCKFKRCRSKGCTS